MKYWLLIPLGAAAGASVFLLFLYNSVVSPLEEREAAARDAAFSIEDITEIYEVSFFHGETSYQVVDAVREDEEDIYLLIPENSDAEPEVLLHSSGITPEEAHETAAANEDMQSVHAVRLGLLEGIPIYEINYTDSNGRLGYYYVSFENGEYIRSYQLGAS
ncbi:MAG: hypothetical protein EA344_09465 [Alkalicoccus sp.]|nr:MAG: hypothetical protein EA344_09465 [Alkalicoccus sp.]